MTVISVSLYCRSPSWARFGTFFLSINLQMVFLVELLRALVKANVPSITDLSSPLILGHLCIFLTSPYNCKPQRKWPPKCPGAATKTVWCQETCHLSQVFTSPPSELIDSLQDWQLLLTEETNGFLDLLQLCFCARRENSTIAHLLGNVANRTATNSKTPGPILFFLQESELLLAFLCRVFLCGHCLHIDQGCLPLTVWEQPREWLLYWLQSADR